jgi:hypothetical protein
MWFWSSGLGPRQHFVKSGAEALLNASVGPKERKKKNAETTNIVTIAQATSGSSMRLRYLRITAAV